MTDQDVVKVGDVLERVRRDVTVDPLSTYEEIGIRSFGKGVFHKPPVEGLELGKKRIHEIHPGDFVLNIVFAWEGAVAVAGPEEAGRVGSHRFPTYRPKPERADARYLLYLFLSDAGREMLASCSPGSAGRNRTLNREAFESLEVTLPPVPVQRRIAAWMDGIADRQTRIAAGVERLQELSRALSGSTLKALGEDVPVVELGEILTLTCDEVPVEPDQVYRPAGIYSFGRGLFARPPIEGANTKYPKLTRLHADQFVYSRLFAWEGALAIVPAQFEGMTVSHEFPTFEIDRDRATPEYLGVVCRWQELWERLRDMTTGLGSRRQRVPVERLLATSVPLPVMEHQKRLGALGKGLVSIQAQSKRSEELINSLIPAVLNERFGGPS